MKSTGWLVAAFFSTTFGFGQVSVTFDSGVESAILTHFGAAKEEKEQGFRVLLTTESGNGSKDAANGVKGAFLRVYPEFPAYSDWDSPSYKVKVGDFKTRLDATLFWKQISSMFPGSYVVVDEINPVRLR